MTTAVELGLTRVAKQFQNSPDFLAYIEALLVPWIELAAALAQVATITDIDLSEGTQLDVLGDLVGILRTVPRGALVGPDLVDVIATDEQYRVLIKARAFKNSSLAHPEDIIESLQLLFPGTTFVFDDLGDMAISVALYGGTLTPFMRSIIVDLDLLPRAAGVKLSVYETTSEFVFGFEGQVQAGTFGEEGNLSIGAPFLEELT